MCFGFAPTLFLHDQEMSVFFFFIIFESHICFSSVFSADVTESYISILWRRCFFSSRAFFCFGASDSCKFYSLADICPHDNLGRPVVLSNIIHVHNFFFSFNNPNHFSLYHLMLTEFSFFPFLLFGWTELRLIRFIMYVNTLGRCLISAACWT